MGSDSENQLSEPDIGDYGYSKDRDTKRRRKKRSRSRSRDRRRRSRSRDRRRRRSRSRSRDRRRRRSRTRSRSPKQPKAPRANKFWDVAPEGFEHVAPKQYKEMQQNGQLPMHMPGVVPGAAIAAQFPMAGGHVARQARRLYAYFEKYLSNS